ncbi:hypothetical protein [Planctomyces sp. SH-PL14]|uniref:hypothetical protein n=1 Tax=Planctomyces sp. SH-PL14 TaxID=1632864 RepID=UPI00078EEB5B|nr:hypothetical protein [Planctomyces sp. SH-PL14]AMV21488.1 hypothetical protein VT03_26530 [Planctomyces sp. SH-PL14]
MTANARSLPFDGLLGFLRDYRARKQQWKEGQLDRLAEVQTIATDRQRGRVITVAFKSPGATFRMLDYLRPWWNTINRIGLRGTVLCSGVPDAEMREITTDCVDCVPITVGPRHIFFERHFAVRDFLRTIDDRLVLITDGRDVAFKRDPFRLMEEDGGRHALFFNREPRRILLKTFMRREMRRQFGRILFPWNPILNPGIHGGPRTEVLRFLDHLTQSIDAHGEYVGTDMSAVNKAAWELYRPEQICCGAPLHSEFKKWEFDRDVAVLHK